MQISKEFTLGTTLLLATLLSTWLAVEVARDHKMRTNSLNSPDAIVEQIHIVRTDLNGNMQDQLFAPNMKHFIHKKITEFSDPHIIFYSTDPAPSHVRARLGEMIHGEKKIATFRDNVHLDQGTTHIACETLVVNFNHENKIDEAIGYGKKGQAQTLATYRTIPEPGKPELVAQAEVIHYYPSQHKVVFLGQAKATQDRSTFAGPRIEYDTLRKMVNTPAAPHARTTILLQPEKIQEITKGKHSS